jgi:inorganic pyrophosphatase
MEINPSVFFELGKSISNLNDLNDLNENMCIIDVFIEISKNSHIKYEYDKQKKALICDRILHTPFKYSFNYGFVPDTLSEDKDPLDVIVLINEELIPGSYIKCKILGYLETKDDEGDDPKIIACPIEKVDPSWKLINDINNIESHQLTKIKYFFQHYKDLENKTVDVGTFKDKNSAIEVYKQSIKRHYDYTLSLSKDTKNKITNYFSPIS